jgi:rubrerythrin
MYPGFIDKAEEEGNARAQKSFEYTNQVEEIHYNLYQEMLKLIKAKQTPKDEAYYVCPVCGNTVAGNAPDVCPICATPGSKFKKME